MALQTILGFDNSASMQTRHGNATRISAAKELAGPVISKACELDPDGPDVYKFGQGAVYIGNISAEQAVSRLQTLQANEFSTDLGAFLTQAFSKAKTMIQQGDNVCILAFTDGGASDGILVQNQIISMTQWMTERTQCGLGIIYFGNEAEAYLKSLDDDLTSKGAKFDIVKTMSIEEAMALDVETLLNKVMVTG